MQSVITEREFHIFKVGIDIHLGLYLGTTQHRHAARAERNRGGFGFEADGGIIATQIARTGGLESLDSCIDTFGAVVINGRQIINHKALELNAERCGITGRCTRLFSRRFHHIPIRAAILQHDSVKASVGNDNLRDLVIAANERCEIDCCGKFAGIDQSIVLEHIHALEPEIVERHGGLREAAQKADIELIEIELGIEQLITLALDNLLDLTFESKWQHQQQHQDCSKRYTYDFQYLFHI